MAQEDMKNIYVKNAQIDYVPKVSVYANRENHITVITQQNVGARIDQAVNFFQTKEQF